MKTEGAMKQGMQADSEAGEGKKNHIFSKTPERNAGHGHLD
jgi:hypothetical protein